jgi:hypothetical protein
MIKKMKLKGELTLQDGVLLFTSTHYDGTPFSVKTTEADLQFKELPNDQIEPIECVLYVILEGQQDSRCYLTLPQPSLQYGRQVTVNRGQLLIHNAPFGANVITDKISIRKI